MTPEPVTASASPFHSRTDRVRTSYRHAVGLLLLAVSGCSPLATTRESGGSTHVFAWAWDVDKDADDFLAVVDVDRRLSSKLIKTLTYSAGPDPRIAKATGRSGVAGRIPIDFARAGTEDENGVLSDYSQS